MLRLVLKAIWKVIIKVLKIVIQIGVFFAYPFVFLSGERRFLPLKDYKTTNKENLLFTLYKGITYILWGSLTFFGGCFLYFTYNSLDVYGFDIFQYERTIEYKCLLGTVTLFLGMLYFFLIFTLTRRTNRFRKIGMISFFSNIGRFIILLIWICILVTPLYINEELQKGVKLHEVEIFENTLKDTIHEKQEIGITERWYILDYYFTDMYLKTEYKSLVWRYMSFFCLALLVKMLLCHVDYKYIERKVKEMKEVI